MSLDMPTDVTGKLAKRLKEVERKKVLVASLDVRDAVPSPHAERRQTTRHGVHAGGEIGVDLLAEEVERIGVDVEFVEKLPRLIALDELRANPALDGMVLLQKGSRLSVQPVSAAHYKAVLAMAKKAAPKAAPKAKARG